jgi:ATP-dependent RNA helicase DDX18/HAS1
MLLRTEFKVAKTTNKTIQKSLLTHTQSQPRNGSGIIIITPTRELAMQIFGVVRDLMQDTCTQTFGVIMG